MLRDNPLWWTTKTDDTEWSLDEHFALLAAVNEHGQDWLKVSKSVQENTYRTAEVCCNYYNKLQNLNNRLGFEDFEKQLIKSFKTPEKNKVRTDKSPPNKPRKSEHVIRKKSTYWLRYYDFK